MSCYRENKYREKIEVEKYECGSCAYYRFEREDETNKCTYYDRYFHYKDSCRNHWSMARDVEEGSGGCFLTTACCEYMGLPDDCRELEAMRAFRDSVLKKSKSGNVLVDYYYKIAPGLVKRIDGLAERERIYDEIYRTILRIINLLDREAYDQAISQYVLLVYNTEKRLDKYEA